MVAAVRSGDPETVKCRASLRLKYTVLATKSELVATAARLLSNVPMRDVASCSTCFKPSS